MSSLKKLIISGFIFLNFLAMARVHMPQDSKLFRIIYTPVDSYLSMFSIYQDWYMFAPDPTRMNFQLTAEVEFMDGSRDHYSFPKQNELTIVNKYLYGEKFRKIVSEGIRKEENQWMWKDTAKFVLRKIKSTHSNRIPAKVHLYKNWDIIPEMHEDFRLHLAKVQNYQTQKFYTYEVF